MKSLKSVFLILLLATFCGCSDKDVPAPDTCLDLENGDNPNWLQTIINDIENDTSLFGTYAYIMTGTYEGQRIFIMKNCCPNCSYVASVYSCQGENLGFLSSQGNEVNPNDIGEERLFWKRSDSICTL